GVTDPMEAMEASASEPLASNGVEEQLKAIVTVDREKGHGSGCIISTDGYVVTNYHVVSERDSILRDSLKIIFHNDREMKGEVVRTNRMADLALIKLDTTGLPVLRIKKEGKARVGSYVFAIGTPKSKELAQTVTQGVISERRKFNKIRYIQTDVSISPGNSGGALIEKASGKLIGIPSVKLIDKDIEGISFAVSSKTLMESLKLRYAGNE
ncbi:MAG: S1C family serine protease, partial [Flavobacteriales bacterium]